MDGSPEDARRARTRQWILLVFSISGLVTLITTGRGVPQLAFAALVLFVFGTFTALVVAFAKKPAIGARSVVGASIGLMILVLAMPVHPHRDIWGYVMYGRIVAVHHASPYTHSPADFPSDPASTRVWPQFRTELSPYGPLFTGVSAAGMASVGNSPLRERLFFQILAAAAIFAAAFVAWRATRSTAALAFIALNPILLVSVIKGGHVDALMAAAIVCGVLLARERPFSAGLLLGAAALIKFNAVAIVAVVGVWLLARSGRGAAAKFGVGAVGFTALGYAAAGGLAALRPVGTQALMVDQHSFWYGIERMIADSFIDSGRSTVRGNADALSLISHLGLAVVVVVALALAVRAARDLELESVVAIALGVYVLASPYVRPWYTAGLMLLLALRLRSRITWALFGFSALLFLVYPTAANQFILADVLRFVLPVLEPLILAGLVVAVFRAGKRFGVQREVEAFQH